MVHGIDRRPLVRVPREHDARRVGAEVPDAHQEVQAAHSRHVHVRHDHGVGSLVVQERQGPLSLGGHVDREALPERALEAREDGFVVVHEEDLGDHVGSLQEDYWKRLARIVSSFPASQGLWSSSGSRIECSKA